MSSEGTQVLGTAMLWHLFNAISIKCLFYSTHESFCTSMSTTSSIQWKMSEIFCLKKKKFPQIQWTWSNEDLKVNILSELYMHIFGTSAL